MRECQRCHEYQPNDRFHPSTGPICRRCRTARKRIRWQAQRAAQQQHAQTLTSSDSRSSDGGFSEPNPSEGGEQQHLYQERFAERATEESCGEEVEDEVDPSPLGAL